MKILFEDQDILAIDKPAGVVVNEAESVPGKPLQTQVREFLVDKAWPSDWESLVPKYFSDEYGSPEEIFKERAGMVHRLDKDTSGVVLFAKHPGSLVALLKAFRERTVHKTYTALVHGKSEHINEEVLSAPIGRSGRDRTRFAITISGRPAVTRFRSGQIYVPGEALYEVLRNGSRGEDAVQSANRLYDFFSIEYCKPETGRTHQIRVHMAHIHHPLVGDRLYAGKKRQKLDFLWCPRHFLHASQIVFQHPRFLEEVSIDSSLPSDLLKVLSLLEQK